MASPVARIDKADRIANLDVLRGVAIVFILFMNIQYMGDFSDPDYFPQFTSWTGFDQAAWWLNRMIDGTQRGLLELLFGAGVLIMARTAMAPDGPVAVADLHMRRNLWLMVFGVFHGVVLLWSGDILLAYGTAALLIFPFRTLSVRWLLVIGIAINALMLLPVADELGERRALVARVAAIEAQGGPQTKADTQTLDEWHEALAGVTAPDPKAFAAARDDVLTDDLPRYIAAAQASWAYVQFSGPAIYFEIIVEAFGTMLIGMALFKTGIIQGTAPRRTYWLLLLLGYGIGFALRIPGTITELRFDAMPDIGWITIPMARLPITLGHIGAITLALGTPLGQRLLAPFQASGRMPMTIYFSASLMAILVFGGPFLGLWHSMGFGALLMLASATIAAQLVFANLWLRHFETGPAEWLWKSLSYAAQQPFVKRDV